ncbi:hypothetical protein [Vibrio tritonius]|uniref:hypothetical protein n=1 Tax=Vibrio tritonius TaxID=1435069 RepID=UPI000837B657|nr:hypothetical protein [Vibrio tritonius]
MPNTFKKIINSISENIQNNHGEYVLNKVVKICIESNYINYYDINNNSNKYKWIQQVVSTHLMVNRVLGHCYKDDEIKFTSQQVIENEDLVVNKIIDDICAKFLASIPDFTSNCFKF